MLLSDVVFISMFATPNVLLDHDSIRWFVKKKTLKMEDGPTDWVPSLCYNFEFYSWETLAYRYMSLHCLRKMMMTWAIATIGINVVMVEAHNQYKGSTNWNEMYFYIPSPWLPNKYIGNHLVGACLWSLLATYDWR